MSIMKKKQVMMSILTSMLPAVVAMVFLIPFAWMTLASIDASATASLSTPDMTLDNFAQVLRNQRNIRSFSMGFYMSFLTAMGVVLVALIAAYPLSRYNIKHKRGILYTLLLFSGLPGATVPMYQLLFRLGLIDSVNIVILMMIAGGVPYAVWMLKNFIDAIPMDLEESAWVEGASRLVGIRKILIPSMLPGLFTIFIFNFSGTWGNFFTPYIFLNSIDKMPVAVTIYQFVGNHGQVGYGALAAFSLLYTLPSIILYAIAQRYMGGGFRMGGATKG